MRKLCLVQFFTWSALFILWIYTTPIVTARVFGATDTASQAYNDGADWVGVLFALYSGVAALYAFILPRVANAIGRRNTHIIGATGGCRGLCIVPVHPRRAGADRVDGTDRHCLGVRS